MAIRLKDIAERFAEWLKQHGQLVHHFDVSSGQVWVRADSETFEECWVELMSKESAPAWVSPPCVALSDDFDRHINLDWGQQVPSWARWRATWYLLPPEAVSRRE